MKNPILHCQKCGHVGEPVVVPSGPHLRANCSACGSYIKFLPKAAACAVASSSSSVAAREIDPRQMDLFGF